MSLRLPNSNHGSSHCVFDRAWKGMENEQLSREGGPEKWRLEEKPFLLKWFPFLRGHVYFQVTFLLFQVIVTRFVKEKGLQKKTVYFFLRPLKSLPLRLISLNLILWPYVWTDAYIYDIFSIQFLLFNQHKLSWELTYCTHTKVTLFKKNKPDDNFGDGCLLSTDQNPIDIPGIHRDPYHGWFQSLKTGVCFIVYIPQPGRNSH